MKRSIKEIINVIKQLRKTPRGRGILFFAFYFVFFLVLAIMFRVMDSNIVVNYDNNTENNNTVTVADKDGYNYAYKYNIQIDGNTHSFDGYKSSGRELFTFRYNENVVIKEYYRQGINYYSKKDNYWVEDISPSENIAIIDNIDQILSGATYISKTEYESGKMVLRYQVSSATISNIVSNRDLDIEEVPNEILITINNNRIDLVELSLNSYCLVNNLCQNSMKITCLYSNFELQGEIASPIIQE